MDDEGSRKKALEGLGIVLVLMGLALLALWMPTYMGFGVWGSRVAYGAAILLAGIGFGGALTEISRLRAQRDADSSGDWPVTVTFAVIAATLYWAEATGRVVGVLGLVTQVAVVITLAVAILGFGVSMGRTIARWDERRTAAKSVKAAEWIALAAALTSLLAGALGVIAAYGELR